MIFPLVPAAQELINLDEIHEEKPVALIYGGIVSEGQGLLPITATFASNRIFMVTIDPWYECPADLNDDGVVSGRDIAFLLAQWGAVRGKWNEQADLNHDGVVNSSDMSILISTWGACD